MKISDGLGHETAQQQTKLQFIMHTRPDTKGLEIYRRDGRFLERLTKESRKQREVSVLPLYKTIQLKPSMVSTWLTVKQWGRLRVAFIAINYASEVCLHPWMHLSM